MKKKVISKMLFFLILLGTIGVYAQSFKFSLSVQNCGYTVFYLYQCYHIMNNKK